MTLARVDLRIFAALAIIAPLWCAPAAHAQLVDPARDTEGPGGPFSWLLRKSGLTAAPADPKDFVKQSRERAQDGTYMPTGVRPPARSLKAKTQAEVKADELALTAASAEHDKISGRPPPGTVPKAPKPAKTPAPPKN